MIIRRLLAMKCYMIALLSYTVYHHTSAIACPITKNTLETQYDSSTYNECNVTYIPAVLVYGGDDEQCNDFATSPCYVSTNDCTYQCIKGPGTAHSTATQLTLSIGVGNDDNDDLLQFPISHFSDLILPQPIRVWTIEESNSLSKVSFDSAFLFNSTSLKSLVLKNIMSLTASDLPLGSLPPQLEFLRISGSPSVTALPEALFGTKFMEELQLTNNQITILDPLMLSNLPLLHSINLNNNRISTFPRAVLNLPYISSILLRDNPISKFEIRPEEVLALESLAVLNLGDDGMDYFVFDNCTSESATVSNVTVQAVGLTLRVCVDDSLPVHSAVEPPTPDDLVTTTTEEPDTAKEILDEIRRKTKGDGDLTQGLIHGGLIGGGVLAFLILVALGGKRQRTMRRRRQRRAQAPLLF